MPLQFLLFNVVNDFSKFYGEHSWHWYFTNALPSLMGPSLVPLILSFSSKKALSFTENRFLAVQLSVVLYILCHRYVIFFSVNLSFGYLQTKISAPPFAQKNYVVLIWQQALCIFLCLPPFPVREKVRQIQNFCFAQTVVQIFLSSGHIFILNINL